MASKWKINPFTLPKWGLLRIPWEVRCPKEQPSTNENVWARSLHMFFQTARSQWQPYPRLSWVFNKYICFLRRLYFDEEQKVQGEKMSGGIKSKSDIIPRGRQTSAAFPVSCSTLEIFQNPLENKYVCDGEVGGFNSYNKREGMKCKHTLGWIIKLIQIHNSQLFLKHCFPLHLPLGRMKVT